MNLEEDQIPREWYCSITQEIMKDPVIASDGFTYQKLAIQQWFTRSDHSPLTGIKLANTNLIPNLALRQTITQFLHDNPASNSKLKLHPAPVAPALYLPDLSLTVSSTKQNNDIYIRCSVQPPECLDQKLIKSQKQKQSSQVRNSCSILCILDVSESMDTDSVLGGKDAESHGFSRLDLVKHSINTMVQFMGDADEIGLVAFSTSARIALPMTRTTKAGKNIVRQTTKNLETIGTTNIWDGFKVSIQLLRQLHQQNRSSTHNIFLLLLTDGQPNLNPPRGIVPTLIKFLEIQKIPVPNIHVFGYGYELDTYLLSEIAEVGYGTYTYIPDCSMVGTSFVNFMANSLATITNDAMISVQIGTGKKKGVEVVGVKGGNNGYHVGAIQFGQSRQFLIKIPQALFQSLPQDQKFVRLSLSYGQNSKTIKKQQKIILSQQVSLQSFVIRQQYLSLLQKLSKQKKSNIHNCYKEIDEFYKNLTQIKDKNSVMGEDEQNLLNALLKQIKNQESENEGQVSKAFQRQEWYEKWGKHYLPSLYRAHLMQVCTNFKDPALQLYGGSIFKLNQSNMDTIFIKMAPPQPSAKKVNKLVYKPAPIDMSDYYNYGGGCIHEDNLVLMQNGSTKAIKDLKKGDKVKNGVIECLVKTPVFGWTQMIKIGNLIITPYHPINWQDEWIFPCNHPTSTKISIFIEYFYNFVLKDSKTSVEKCLQIEGIKCVGLGHNLSRNEVVSHQYFESRVVQDLEGCEGWRQGEVTIKGFLRNQVSKKINGIIKS